MRNTERAGAAGARPTGRSVAARGSAHGVTGRGTAARSTAQAARSTAQTARSTAQAARSTAQAARPRVARPQRTAADRYSDEDHYQEELLSELTARLRGRFSAMRQAGRNPAELGEPGEVAELMLRRLPHAHPLAGKVGPFYDTPTLAEWLQVSRQALNSRVRNHTLLGLPTRDHGSRVYPTWQFRDDGSTIPHLTDVLRTLARGSDNPWTWALWLTAAVPDATGSGDPAASSVAQRLAANADPEPILAEARADAERWAA